MVFAYIYSKNSYRKRTEMEEMERFFNADSFARYLGIELLEVSEGKARAKLPLKPHHLNSMGTVHGGVIFSLADAVFAVASNSHGTVSVAINVSISYFKARTTGTLIASADEVSINPRLATYLITVADENGGPVALFNGTVYRKKEKLSDMLPL